MEVSTMFSAELGFLPLLSLELVMELKDLTTSGGRKFIRASLSRPIREVIVHMMQYRIAANLPRGSASIAARLGVGTGMGPRSLRSTVLLGTGDVW